jgi:hypothetical protein
MQDLTPEMHALVEQALIQAEKMANGQVAHDQASTFREVAQAGIVVLVKAGQKDIDRLALYGFTQGVRALAARLLKP